MLYKMTTCGSKVQANPEIKALNMLAYQSDSVAQCAKDIILVTIYEQALKSELAEARQLCESYLSEPALAKALLQEKGAPNLIFYIMGLAMHSDTQHE